MGRGENAVDFVSEKFSQMALFVTQSVKNMISDSGTKTRYVCQPWSRLMAPATNSTSGDLPASQAVKPCEAVPLVQQDCKENDRATIFKLNNTYFTYLKKR